MQRKMVKTLPTDRHRGGAAFVETRTGAFYGRLGYLAGLGRPASRIAEDLGGEVCPEYVNKTLARWGVKRDRWKTYCQVPLTRPERQWVDYQAEKAGISPEEYLRRVITKAAMPS